MLRLNEDLGFKAHFSDPEIDWVRRLPANASNEDAYATFRKHVKVGYDPTEGIVRMEVSAADPALSAAFSKALIGYAEEQVDNLTQRLREDQMVGAREAFAEAEAKMVAAQRRVLELQEKLGVLDPVSETSSVMGQVSNFEIQLGEKRLQLRQLLDNPQPNQARVSGVEGDIARLESLIADLRAQLTTRVSGVESLAQVSSQLRMAEVDLETRTLMMQETLNSLESSRAEANRQVRYLSLGVNPVPPDEASYPRALENTALALLVFSGIYLLVSLTVSILREQVSS
jgi:capsular polysaccharide transport system permease protein